MPQGPIADQVHCDSLAGPFSRIHNNNAAFIIYMILFIVSIVLTSFSRRLVVGYILAPLQPTAASPTTGQCSNCEAECPHCGVEPQVETQPDDLPPPYSSTEASQEPSPAAEPKVDVPRHNISVQRSTGSLVLGTTLFVLNIITLVFLAFSIQCYAFCSDTSPANDARRLSTGAGVMWFFYSLVALWATFGVASWLILIRDYISGPGVEFELEIQQELGPLLILCIVMLPFMLVYLCLKGVFDITKGWFTARSSRKEQDGDESRNLVEMGPVATHSDALESNESVVTIENPSPAVDKSKQPLIPSAGPV